MNLLELQHIKKYFATQKAVDDISFDIKEGSIFGLLGPNGAGKTTLLRMITGIFYPDSGTINLNGKKFNPGADAALIGYMPEERGLYKKMKIGEQALYLARLKGLSKADAMQKLKYWFEKFEIQTWWKKKVEELSKGMAQKVQFITTILHDPTFLILDEPFTGFDPINAELIKNELLELKEKGVTIVLSTHRMESVEELCSHIALINNAEVILEGAVKDIRKLYKSNSYEIQYIGNKIAFTNALWTGFELLDLKEESDHQIANIRMIGDHSTNELLQLLMPHVQILGFREIIPGMNDIFIQKVGEARKHEEKVSI